MRKIKFHPIFLVFAIYLIFMGQARYLLASIFAVLIHEYAHSLMAKERGYSLNKINLMPFGATLSGDLDIESKDLRIIALAGPFINFFLASIAVSFWWLYPNSYALTETFVYANLVIGIFNLLPFFPLDGAKFLIALSKNNPKMLNLTRVLAVIFGVVCVLLFISSAFYKINYGLLIIGAMLIFGGIFEGEKEKYTSIFNNIFHIKNLFYPIEKCELYVNSSMKVKTLLKALNANKIYTIYVVDNSLNVLKILDNSKLEKLLLISDKNIKIGKLI